MKDGCSVLIVEEELVGGDCPFWACVPSKVLLNSVEALPAAASKGGAKASSLPGKVYDAEATFARRDVFTGNYKDSALLVPMVEGAGVVIARGVGSLNGKKRVKIVPATGDAVEVQADLAVILGLGSVAAIPNIPGLKESNPWTPRDATSAQKVPEHLIVIGAGAVGTEMATAYATLGGKVSLISRSKEILPAVDVEAGRVVREALQAKGVDVKLGAEVVKVQRESADRVSVILSTGEQLQGSEVLIATGRKGVHDRVGLQTVGAQTKGNFIPVAEDLSVTTNDDETWLYAAGDMNGRALLTHVSKYHGRIVSSAIKARKRGETLQSDAYTPYNASADHAATTQVIFTDPPVSSVGLTRARAVKRGLKVREITAPFISLGGRIASDSAIEGWAQWLVDENNRLVGATFVGDGAADVLHASTVAVVGGVTLDRLSHAIPSFPTVSEVYLNLIDAAGL